MKIHHNTLRRAASLGFTMTLTATALTIEGEIENGVISTLTFPVDKSAKVALEEAVAARAAHAPKPARARRVDADEDGEEEDMEDEDGEEEDMEDEAEDEAEDDMGDEADEVEVADAIDEAEEGSLTGSVVKDKYREIYRARGNPDHCGDDLALKLAEVLKGDIDRLRLLAETHGIDFARYETGTRGWQGRARMSIGNHLRGLVRKGAKIILDI